METLKLGSNWKRVFKKAWSVRLALLSGFFSAASGLTPFFQGFIDPLPFALLASFFAFGAVIARLVYQGTLDDDSKPI